MIRRLASVLAGAALITATAAAPAVACGHHHHTPPPPPPVEVQACWTINNPDFTRPTVAEFPQTYYGETCPTTIPGCDSVKFQHDWYWLRSESDDQLLAWLQTNGLGLDQHGRPQDSPLEPHNWSVFVLHGTDQDYNGDDAGCGTPPPPPPVDKAHASYRLHKFGGCAPTRRAVTVTHRHHIDSVRVRYAHHRTVAHVRVTADEGATFPGGSAVSKRTVHLNTPNICRPHHHGS